MSRSNACSFKRVGVPVDGSRMACDGVGHAESSGAPPASRSSQSQAGCVVSPVLSPGANAQFQAQGFVRTGLVLSGGALSAIRDVYREMPASESNWSYFESNVAAKLGAQGARARMKRLLRSLVARRKATKPDVRIYEKSIYGSTAMIPMVLEQLLAQGLKDHLADMSFLAAHDILLEGTKDDHSFGFHHDGFGWDIFFQTGDDVTIYIALQDLNHVTGGRLSVERHPEDSVLFEGRNREILSLAQFFREQGAGLRHGRVTKEGAETCRRRRHVADAYHKLVEKWDQLTTAHRGKIEMTQIDMRKGEVILFNNKMFHDVERWKSEEHRLVYIIRCLPLYDMGLCPPQTFLNGVACNRYLLDGAAGCVRPMDLRSETLPFEPCPLP